MGGRYGSRDETRLYVGNLVDSTTTVDLDSLFSKYGKITNIWVARNPPGFAFVTFDDPRDAKDAIYELNGKEFKGNSLRVEKSRDRQRKRPSKDPYSRSSPRYKRSRTRSRSSGRRYRSRSPSYRKARSRS